MHFPTTEKPLNIAIVASSFYTVRSTENYELELVKNALSAFKDETHIHPDDKDWYEKGRKDIFHNTKYCENFYHNILKDKVSIIIVPGAMEIPQACQWLIDKGNIDGILAVGCVVRGKTTHYDHVCHTAFSGLQTIALQQKTPIATAIVTADEKDVAERVFAEIDGKPAKNLGFHGMNALLDMIKLKNSL